MIDRSRKPWLDEADAIAGVGLLGFAAMVIGIGMVALWLALAVGGGLAMLWAAYRLVSMPRTTRDEVE